MGFVGHESNATDRDSFLGGTIVKMEVHRTSRQEAALFSSLPAFQAASLGKASRQGKVGPKANKALQGVPALARRACKKTHQKKPGAVSSAASALIKAHL